MSKVTVTADKSGNIINVSETNPEYGYVRVESTAMSINEGGWLRSVKRSALIKGLVKDLLETGFKNGQELRGKIIVRESLEPFNPVNPDRDLKVAGETGIICRLDDQPIYRQTFFTSNVDAEDDLIMHNNQEEIKLAQQAHRELERLVRRPVSEKSEAL